MSRRSDEIRAVRSDLSQEGYTVDELLKDANYIQALDAEVERLEAENPRLAARYGTKS